MFCGSERCAFSVPAVPALANLRRHRELSVAKAQRCNRDDAGLVFCLWVLGKYVRSDIFSQRSSSPLVLKPWWFHLSKFTWHFDDKPQCLALGLPKRAWHFLAYELRWPKIITLASRGRFGVGMTHFTNHRWIRDKSTLFLIFSLGEIYAIAYISPRCFF